MLNNNQKSFLKCSKCGVTAIKSSATFCYKCGKPLASINMHQTSQLPNLQLEKNCFHCGKPIKKTDKFCIYCGKMLKRPATSNNKFNSSNEPINLSLPIIDNTPPSTSDLTSHSLHDLTSSPTSDQIQKKANISESKSQFCTNCGTKYHKESSKFCIECGLKIQKKEI